MTPADWLSLADLCEAARGADRSLDELIGLQASSWDRNPEGESDFLPEYTGSVDALLALIAECLPGWSAALFTKSGPETQDGAQLCLWVDLGRGSEGWSCLPECRAATPALALCAALALAMASQAGETT